MAHVINVVDTAVKTALGRRTVAHLTIPKDVQEWTSRDEPRSASNVPGRWSRENRIARSWKRRRRG